MNALEAVKLAGKSAEQIATSAESYLQLLSDTPRPAIKLGTFYRTIDGSVVFVAKLLTKCTCAYCSGKRGGLLGMFAGSRPDEQPDADPATHVESETPKQYVAVVLHGGHGLKNVRGEATADTYLIDSDGYSVLNPPAEDSYGATNKIPLALAGLCLAKELTAKFEAVELDAKRA